MFLALVKDVDEENPDEGDLLLRNGDLVWSSDVLSEIEQRIRCRLLFFQGEWFADAREGVPYYQRLLAIKNVSDLLIESVFSSLLLSVAGVVEVLSIRVLRDAVKRTARVVFSVRCDGGHVFTSADSSPFILRF